jgi:phospholipid/cholesterol/gamma-HCH transport system ATP-binding protein
MDQPVLELRGVYKSFGRKEVLRGVDLKVERGTTLVILGVSGSGKSVLIKHMAGLLRPDRGRVFIEGNDLARLNEDGLAQVREHFGMVFQNSALFDGMTVFDNVAFPLRERHPHLHDADLSKAVQAKLKLFELSGTESLFPEELSGGMRKRVALARATVLDPEIVLYDEPTTGLDPILTESVVHLIQKAKQELGVTSVVICHDLAAALEVADRVAFLHDGRIQVNATPSEALQTNDPDLKHFLSLWKESREETLHDSPVT